MTADSTQQDDALMSVDAVAALLDVSKATATRLMHDMPVVKIGSAFGRPGGRLRVRRSDFERWLAANTAMPGQGTAQFMPSPARPPVRMASMTPVDTEPARSLVPGASDGEYLAWLIGGGPEPRTSLSPRSKK